MRRQLWPRDCLWEPMGIYGKMAMAERGDCIREQDYKHPITNVQIIPSIHLLPEPRFYDRILMG